MNERISIDTPSKLPIYYTGPQLNQGPLPAIFYFALSAQETLFIDPYNQPCLFLKEMPVRVYSATLPFHGEGFKNTKALGLWVQAGSKGNDIIGAFLKECCQIIDFLIEKGYVEKNKIATVGLSRGGFIATHLAAKQRCVSHVLGYAPMTALAAIHEFHNALSNTLVSSWALENQLLHLINKKIRYYIGNFDTRVGTRCCFDFVEKLVHCAYEHRVRSPRIELIITASVGHKGHGTLPKTFKAGVEWLAEEWKLS